MKIQKYLDSISIVTPLSSKALRIGPTGSDRLILQLRCHLSKYPVAVEICRGEVKFSPPRIKWSKDRTILYAQDLRSGKIRQRTVNTEEYVFRAREDGKIWAAHGGSGKFSSETEVCLVVPVDTSFGRVCIVWASQRSAQSITMRAAAEECLPGAGDIFDGRVSPERKNRATERVKRIARKHVERYYEGKNSPKSE